MPKPLHIICSQSYAMDKRTNRLSIFDIVEGVSISKVKVTASRPVAIQIIQGPTVCVVAVWMREDESADQMFEGELVAHVPRPGQPHRSVVMAEGKFRFTTLVHRLVHSEVPLPPLEGPGMFRLESRIRPIDKEGKPVGTGEWISQETYIVVHEVVPSSQEDGNGQEPSPAPSPPPGPAPSSD